MAKRTRGLEILEQLNDGRLQQAPTEYLQKTRAQVIEALGELIEVGARIRPLLVGGKRVVWVRGIAPSERKAVRRSTSGEAESIEPLPLARTLPLGDVRAPMTEMQSLPRLIRRCKKC
ncbi:MAG: hypothetical protein JO270_23675 [Acidobacteriaceae bacterium]|nr:hypothetical protein [Acidobacteriaceae bacterium]